MIYGTNSTRTVQTLLNAPNLEDIARLTGALESAPTPPAPPSGSQKSGSVVDARGWGVQRETQLVAKYRLTPILEAARLSVITDIREEGGAQSIH